MDENELDWIRIGDHWAVDLHEDNAPDRLEIYPADDYTERNCKDYDVEFNPDAKFVLYRVFDDPITEYCTLSLHMTLDEAKCAGYKYWETL